MSGFRASFLWPVSLGTLCLVALCAFTAVSLFRQQAAITGVLRESVSSRQAAADLRDTLNVLVALETRRYESVDDLHRDAESQLETIRRLADNPREQELSAHLDQAFEEYLRKWEESQRKSDPKEHADAVATASTYLLKNVLYPCRDLEAFNDQRVEEMTAQHERVLGRLAWGMAVIAVLGAVAGVVFGYGVARLFSQSIRRLHVQIRAAAGKLGPDPPEIVLTGDIGFGGLHDELENLSARIETVVQRLNDREREVARADQLAALGQLAAGVGHELRNPLTSIKMLVQTGLEDEPARLTAEDLRVIEAAARRMERTLQTFLDFARPPKPERRPVELGAVCGSVLGLVRGRAEKQQVTTKLELPDGPITLTVDIGQFRQVLVNLILNALDAMPRGGAVTVTARRADAWVEVEVADTGPGIAPDMAPRLFQPFASSKDTGLGLGLVISQRIVEDHGGTIEAGDRPGGGARFVVRLPAEDVPHRKG